MRARIIEFLKRMVGVGGAAPDVPAAVALILTLGWVTWSMRADELYGFGWFLEQPATVGLPLLLLLLLVMALCGVGVRSGFLRPAQAGGRPLELIALGVILLAAAALRLHGLGRYPRTFDLDNAQNGYVAMQLWAELTRGSYTAILERWAPGNETLMFYLQGLTMQLFGISVEALRLPSALLGTLTVYLIYRLGREQISTWVGLAAALLCTLSPWHLDLSRSAKRSVLIPLFACLVLLFLCRALRRAPSARACLDLALCGAMLGLGLHSYELFRVAPLAAVGAILWVRVAQKRRPLWHGPAEVTLVLGVAALVALPIILAAIASPENYFHHTAHASLLGAALSQGELLPLLSNGGQALAHALDHIPLGIGWIDLRGAPLATSTLFLIGLFAMLGLAWAPGGADQKGEGGPRVWIAALACMLGIMVGVLLLTRVHHAPRRYTGLMVPFFLVGGGAAVGIINAAIRRLGRHLSALLVLAAVVVLALPMSKVFALMATYQEDYSQARAEGLLRWAAAQAGEKEVYLSAGVLDNHYMGQFLLSKPGLRQLPTGMPLPQGPLEGEVLLVANGEQWGATLTKLAGAKKKVVELPLPAKVLGDDPVTDPRLEVEVWEVSGAALARHRIPPASLTHKFGGVLVTGEPGRYAFRLQAGATGTLSLGTITLELAGEKELAVNLTSGLTPVVYTGGPARGRIQWRPPGEDSWAPLPAGLLWNLPAGILPMAAPPEEEGWVSEGAEPRPIMLDASEEDDLNTLQDLAPAGDSAYVLNTNLNSLVRLAADTWETKRIPLTGENEDPFGVWYYQTSGRRSAYQQQFPVFRISVSGRGFFLLDRLRGVAHRFDKDGSMQGKLRGPFVWPLDLAADEDAVYVADHGRRAILWCDPMGHAPARELIGDVVPTSVSVLDGALAYTDQATHEVVVLLLDGLKVESRTTLQAVTDTTSVTLLEGGIILVTQPKRQQVHLLSRRGGGLAISGNPGLMNHPVPVFSPRGGFRATDGKELLVLGENELVLVPLQQVEGPEK